MTDTSRHIQNQAYPSSVNRLWVLSLEQEPLDQGHGTCVLVVEDNAEVGNFATEALAELGYVTVLVANAEEALAELARNADRFDVVFSDVVMPGMNGMDLAHEIRRQHAALPVVLTSGYSNVLAENGTDGFELLHKPYSVDNIARVIRKVATSQRRSIIASQPEANMHQTAIVQPANGQDVDRRSKRS